MFDRERDYGSADEDRGMQSPDGMTEIRRREVSAGDDIEGVSLDTPVPERRRRPTRREDTPLDAEVVRVRRESDFAEGAGPRDYRYGDPDEPPFDPDEPTDADREEVEDADREEVEDADADNDEGEPKPRREHFRLLRQIFLGTILNSDHIRENYRYAVVIAGMLFLSIVMLFSSLGAYVRYTTLEREVRLLRERSIRMSEQRYEQSSHSAVVRRLQERGIDLEDPLVPRERL